VTPRKLSVDELFYKAEDYFSRKLGTKAINSHQLFKRLPILKYNKAEVTATLPVIKKSRFMT